MMIAGEFRDLFGRGLRLSIWNPPAGFLQIGCRYHIVRVGIRWSWVCRLWDRTVGRIFLHTLVRIGTPEEWKMFRLGRDKNILPRD